jgi:predicted transporter
VTMGVATAREWNRHGHDLSRKTFWVLSVPCPACLAATFLSCSALAGLLEVAGWKVGAVVGLIFFVSIAILSTTVGKVGKAPSALGNVMIFVGLFYILSMLLIPAYLKTQSIPFVPVTIPASDLFTSYFFILGLVVLGFVGRRMGVFL